MMVYTCVGEPSNPKPRIVGKPTCVSNQSEFLRQEDAGRGSGVGA